MVKVLNIKNLTANKTLLVVGALVLLAIAAVLATASISTAPDASAAVIADGDLVKTSISPDIYIVKKLTEKSFKRLILNPEIFNSYGHLKWENVKTITAQEMASFSASELVRAVSDSRVYRLTSSQDADTGVKYWLNMTADEFTAEGYDWDSIYEMNDAEHNMYQSGAEIKMQGKGGNTEATGVTVALSNTTPDSASVGKGASNVVFAKIDLANTDAENAVITAITVSKNGLAQYTDISEIKLWDGLTQLGSPNNLNQTTNKATFTALNWVIPASQTKKTLTITANISSTATTANSPRLGIVMAGDITTASKLMGTFPVYGNAMNIAGLAVGRLDVTARTVPGDNQPISGSVDQEIASWTFEAVSEGMSVQKIVINQVGSASNDDLKDIKLRVNGVQIGGTVTALSSTRTAEFDLSTDPLVINSGSSKIVYAYASVGTGSTITNRTIKFEITNSADVTTLGSNSNNRVEITTDEGGDGSTFSAQDGVQQTIKQGGGFSVTINGATNPSAKTFVSGRTQELLSSFRFSAGSGEDMRVVRLKLKLFGTGAEATDLSNVTLYAYNQETGAETQVGAPTSFLGTIATYGFNSSSLDQAIFEVKKNANTVIHVRADISTSASWTGLGIGINEVKVDGVQSQADIASADISISAVDATNGTEATQHGANLASGNLTLVVNSSNPAGQDVAPGIKDYTFGKFDFTATGEDIILSSLTLNLCDGATCTDGSAGTAQSGDFTNIKLINGATQLGTTVAVPTTSASFNFNLTIKKDQMVTLTVTSDVPTSAVTDWASAKGAVAVDRDLTATGVSSSATISDPSTDALGNAMTAISETLTVAFQSLPSSTLVKNGSDALIARFVLSAGTAGDVRVSSIKFSADDATTLNGASSANTTFGSLKLYDVTSDKTQLGTVISSFSDGTVDTATFNSLSVTIQKSISKIFELRANSLTTTGSALYVGIDDLTASNGTDVIATGLNSNTTVYGTGTDSANSGVINVVSSGSITVSVDASTPVSKIIAVGASGVSGVELAKFKFSATNEAMKLQALKITMAQSNSPSSANDVPSFVTIKLYNGATLLATEYLTGSNTTATVAKTLNFNGNSVMIPKDESVVLTLKADLNGTANGAVSMTTPNFTIFDVAGTADLLASDLSAQGVDSGIKVSSSAGFKDPSTLSGTEPTNVNAITIAKSKPVFTLVNPATTSLMPGITEVMRFKISAEGDDVNFDGTNHNIRFTIAQSGGTATGRTARLFEVGKSAVLQTITGLDLTSAGTIDFNAITTTIANGSSKEFYVDVDLTDYSSSGETFRLSIGNATADLSWNDGITTDITSTLTDGLPITGGTLVK